jgi:hypothetical protein
VSVHQHILSSETNEWYTPAIYVEAAREVMGGITLDPASCMEAQRTVQADVYYGHKPYGFIDGLSYPWAGNVFLNPPYGKTKNKSNAGIWTARLTHEVSVGRVKCAILLVNASTGAKWFQPLFNQVLCFVEGRIKFEGHGKTQPTHSNVFAYFGDNPGRFREVFGQFGKVGRLTWECQT